jgi:tRNA (mo5U34)-methyltransferase
MNSSLANEISQPTPWMYPWALEGDLTVTVGHPELPEIHQTRLEMMRGPVQAALAAAGPEPRVIDLACNEGWFSHRMLEWGAAYVLGVDVRPQLIRRAQLVRDHFGIPSERMELRCADVFDLSAAELGSFDVVLCLGLVYHLENPVGAIRIARRVTRGICVIESQLTRQTAPIVHGWGASDHYESTSASFASRVESDYESNWLASTGGVVSLVPNRAALVQAVEAAGFARQELIRPASTHNKQYVSEDRVVLCAWP